MYSRLTRKTRKTTNAPDTPGLGGFEWRQRALVRLYKRELGFLPIEGPDIVDGLMWRARDDALTDILAKIADDERPAEA